MDDCMTSFVKCPIFAGVNQMEITELIRNIQITKRRFYVGTTIFYEGDPSDEIGIVLYGYLALKKYQPNGNVISVFYRKTGDVIGGGIVFSKNKCYPYDVVVVQETEVAFIRKKEFLTLLSNNSILTSNMLELFAERISLFESKMELLSFSSIQKKIAYSLLYDFGAENRAIIYLPFTRQAWAEHLNVSRPSLSRELKLMTENGIIECKKNKITILDCSKLEQIIEK